MLLYIAIYWLTCDEVSSICQKYRLIQLTAICECHCVCWPLLAYCHFDCHLLTAGGRICAHLTTEYRLIGWNAEVTFAVAAMMTTAPRCLIMMSATQWILMRFYRFSSGNNFRYKRKFGISFVV